METQQILKSRKKKKNRAGVIRFPDFRLYYKAIIKQYGTGTKAQTQINGKE